MTRARTGRWRRSLEHLRGVAAAPGLRWLEIAWSGCIVADYAETVALAVVAYRAGGVGAVGVMGIVRAAPAALAAPVLATIAERWPGDRVLKAVLAGRGVLFVLLGVAAAADHLTFIYAIAALNALIYSAYWPAQSALLPRLTDSAEDLEAANIVATTIENVGTLVGPVIAGVLIGTGGSTTVFIACAGVSLAAAAAMARVAGETGDAAPPPPARARAGVEAVAVDRVPRLIVALYLAETLVVGALGVLVVVIAEDIANLGESGVGYLNGAIGVGGIAGSIVTLALVGRRQLAAPFGVSLVLVGGALAAIAVVSHALPIVGLLALVGIGEAISDATALTLLQRVVRERILEEVLGILEGLWWAAFGVGAVLEAALIEFAGARVAIASTGVFAALVAVLAFGALRAIDRLNQVPDEELKAILAVPLFERQHPSIRERLASDLRRVDIEPGQVVARAGDRPEALYIVCHGRVQAGDVELQPGDYFGDGPLLTASPVPVSLQAVTAGRLYALDHDDFLDGMTQHGRRARRHQLLRARHWHRRAK